MIRRYFTRQNIRSIQHSWAYGHLLMLPMKVPSTKGPFIFFNQDFIKYKDNASDPAIDDIDMNR